MAYQKQIYQDGVTEYTDTLFEHIDDGIFGAYPVQLIAISDTAPSECVENDKYYNTSTKKIYTATGTNTWGTNGETPLEDTAYWLISENGSYAWNGTDLVSIGGGKAEVVISDEEPEEGKLWVDTGEIQVVAGKENLVNAGLSVDSSFKTNILHSRNLLQTDASVTSGIGLTITQNSDNTCIVNGTSTGTGNITWAKNITLKKGHYYFSFNQRYAMNLWFLKQDNSALIITDSLNNADYFELTLTEDTTFKELRSYISSSGKQFSNLKFSPMIYTSLPMNYEPYIVPSIYVGGDEIYSKEEWEDITSQITMASGFTLSSGKLFKKGKQIIGDLVVNGTFATDTQATILTLPNAPAFDINSFCGFSSNEYRLTHIGYMYISTNKSIVVRCATANTYAKLQINYITND